MRKALITADCFWSAGYLASSLSIWARARVSVGDGNEVAWVFYRKFGFYPRMTVLEQKKE